MVFEVEEYFSQQIQFCLSKLSLLQCGIVAIPYMS